MAGPMKELSGAEKTQTDFQQDTQNQTTRTVMENNQAQLDQNIPRPAPPPENALPAEIAKAEEQHKNGKV